MIPAQPKFDWIPKRRATNDLHIGPVAKSHLEQPSAKLLIATDARDGTMAAIPDLIQGTGLDRTTVVALRK